MRTTLTLEDDVAAQLEAMRRRRGASLKDVVNDALRAGLQQMEASGREPQRKPFRTRTFDSVPLIPSFDNITEVLAFAEGEDFK